MAVQAHVSPGRRLSQARAAGAPEAPPPDGPVVELVGHRADLVALDSAVLPHQLHEIDQVLEIARLSELLVEKDARIALLERGIAEWRERAHAETSARLTAERESYEREHQLIGIIHRQLGALEGAESVAQAALARNDELQARLDDQLAAIETSEQTSQAAVARMHELQGLIEELEEKLRRRSRRWWRRHAA
jgi:chromosome segregation ATPase